MSAIPDPIVSSGNEAVQRGGRIVLAQFADYDRATGGFVYNSRIGVELRALGWAVEQLDLPPGFPQPTPEAVDRIAAAIAELPDATPVLIDQVCLSRILAVAEREGDRIAWIDIFHHPMVHDLPPGDPARDAIDGSERAALAVSRLVLATSLSTAATLVRDYGVASARIATAPPGFPRLRAMPRAKSATGPVRLLSVGAMVPRKDYPLLLEALALVPSIDWHLDIVGNTDRDPAHAAEIHNAIDQLRLRERVAIRGRLSDEDLEALWAEADLYAAASRHEGFGMAIAEALGRGVPVVTTEAGAVADWLSGECAIIVPAGDRAALASALATALSDSSRRRDMSAAALEQAARLPTWSDTAEAVSKALAGLTRLSGRV
ncbi:MAG: glycosyltransferase family 4 protein [Hyphomicrobiaceae bacterium]|nr:glycosyltransferase family 4 protein [Hyphomicrobiaceae bacterium]